MGLVVWSLWFVQGSVAAVYIYLYLYLGYTYTKKVFVTHQKFKVNFWVFHVGLFLSCQP